MKIINKYRVTYKNIQDELIVYTPDNYSEKKDIFKFRYNIYFRNGYIEDNFGKVDVDEYDEKESTDHLAVLSVKRGAIIGYLRIINSKPLPIIKDCFNFQEPFLIKFFGGDSVCEISRLIVDKYGDKDFLPRHLIMFILIKNLLIYSRQNKKFFAYGFIKEKLFNKFRRIRLPFFKINKYKQKYSDGVLQKYFTQLDNPVVPVYFNYHIMKLYVAVYFLKFRNIINVSN